MPIRPNSVRETRRMRDSKLKGPFSLARRVTRVDPGTAERRQGSILYAKLVNSRTTNGRHTRPENSYVFVENGSTH